MALEHRDRGYAKMTFFPHKNKFHQAKPDDVNRTNRTRNQLNAIELNRMIEIRLPNAIESRSNITVK